MQLSVTSIASGTYDIEVVMNLANSAIGNISMALFRAGDDPAKAAVNEKITAANDMVQLVLNHRITGLSGTDTFRVRAGNDAAGTTTFNGSAGGRIFGGVMSSSITIREIW